MQTFDSENQTDLILAVNRAQIGLETGDAQRSWPRCTATQRAWGNQWSDINL